MGNFNQFMEGFQGRVHHKFYGLKLEEDAYEVVADGVTINRLKKISGITEATPTVRGRRQIMVARSTPNIPL